MGEINDLLDYQRMSNAMTTKMEKHGIHHLKSWPRFFRQVREGSKTFEIRKNDRDFRVGDVLVLHEWDPGAESDREADRYTGSMVTGVVEAAVGAADLADESLGLRGAIGQGFVVLGVRWAEQ